MIRGFKIYKSLDFGIYHQIPSSVVIRNTSIVDSTVSCRYHLRFILFYKISKVLLALANFLKNIFFIGSLNS